VIHESLGLVGLDVGFAVAGEALLVGLGLVRGLRAALRFLPLAVVVGWAATAIAVSVTLMTGLDLSAALVIVLLGLLAGLGLVLAQLVPARQSPPALGESGLLGRGAAAAGIAVLVFSFWELCRRSLASGRFDNDVWAFWLPRAKTIAYFGGLDLHPGGFASFPHADYPPLTPASEAVSFKFMDAVDPLMLPIQHWVIALAFVGALAGLLAHRVRPAVLWPSLAMLSLVPTFDNFVGSSLGEEPLVELYMLAVVAAALWLLQPEPRTAALCAIFLAAGVLAKNEGAMLAVALLLMLLATGRPHRHPLTAAAFVAAPALAFASWRIWLSANHIAVPDRDFRLQDVFDISYLGDRADRLRIALANLPRTLFDPGNLLLSTPLTLALVAVLLVARHEQRLAVFSLGTVVLAFFAYAVIYWIGLPDIQFYLDSSAGRLMADVGLTAAVLFPLLLSETLTAARRE
jgi:hypothetical protein